SADPSAVRLDDSFNNRQPEPDATSAFAGTNAEEFLENARLRARRQARPMIGYFDPDRVAVQLCGDLDRAVGGRVFQHIVDQVDEYLLDEHTIHLHEWIGVREIDLDLAAAQSALQVLQRRADDFLDGEPFLFHDESPGLQAGHV